MFSKANAVKIFFCFVVLALFAFSKSSYADWSVGVNVGGPGYHHDDHGYHHDDHGYYHDDHGYYGWHDHPHYGWHYHHLPPGYFGIWVGGERYYYYNGVYYRYVGDGDYVLVNPPMGAYVSVIPPDFQPVIINGRTYYTDDGVYYRLTDRGYKVVNPPVVYEQPAPVIVAQPVQQVVVTQAVISQDTFPVNVPNKSGGYTSVVVRKSGNGYVGPQGEFYASFPSVAQLKAMYAK